MIIPTVAVLAARVSLNLKNTPTVAEVISVVLIGTASDLLIEEHTINHQQYLVYLKRSLSLSGTNKKYRELKYFQT